MAVIKLHLTWQPRCYGDVKVEGGCTEFYMVEQRQNVKLLPLGTGMGVRKIWGFIHQTDRIDPYLSGNYITISVMKILLRGYYIAYLKY